MLPKIFHTTRFRSAGLKLAAVALAGCLALAGCGSNASSASGNGHILIGLITKTETTPFFVQMRQAAQAEAARTGVELQAFAGKSQVDSEAQVQAIETLIARKATAIMVVAIDPAAIKASLERAKKAGILIIALDTPLQPGVADSTIATNNFTAGQLIGQWAKAKMIADGTYNSARVALLDMSVNKVSLDIGRDQGFMQGFGFNIGDPNVIGDEPPDPRIVGHEVTNGDPAGGRTAMENLLQRSPNINVVYAMSEQPAIGAYEAIKAAGKAGKIMVVAIDGQCSFVPRVKAGEFSASSVQFPSKMATLGVQAVVNHVQNKAPLQASVDSGVQVYAATPVNGLNVKDITWAQSNCWG
jgi:fructose transport system substrate-binding protein